MWWTKLRVSHPWCSSADDKGFPRLTSAFRLLWQRGLWPMDRRLSRPWLAKGHNTSRQHLVPTANGRFTAIYSGFLILDGTQNSSEGRDVVKKKEKKNSFRDLAVCRMHWSKNTYKTLTAWNTDSQGHFHDLRVRGSYRQNNACGFRGIPNVLISSNQKAWIPKGNEPQKSYSGRLFWALIRQHKTRPQPCASSVFLLLLFLWDHQLLQLLLLRFRSDHWLFFCRYYLIATFLLLLIRPDHYLLVCSYSFVQIVSYFCYLTVLFRSLAIFVMLLFVQIISYFSYVIVLFRSLAVFVMLLFCSDH